MNSYIVKILTDTSYVERIRRKLPPAFEMVEKELEGNPAVGLLREHVIIGMLVAFLGEDLVKPVTRGVHPDIDCNVGEQALSIKTVSMNSGIRIKWTANARKAEEFMASYKPQSDLLIIRIVWGGSGYVLYVPIAVQERIQSRLGHSYLDYRTATNTRGINLSSQAESKINEHPNCFTVPVSWYRSGTSASPYKKWVSYWESP